MVQVAPIKLQYSPKTLWFDPNNLEIKSGDSVVVSTARGTEFGHAVKDIIDVPEKDIKGLKTKLKPVLRLATSHDEDMAQQMMQKSHEALPLFKEMAAEVSQDMHPVSVEYLLEGGKAIFYFEAEERIDFRELVRKLAAHFHVRVDMRQIGVRDEARMVGGIGHCGQELCCKRIGGEFCPVSIRMAKEQDLSLNPQKISGVCGRLMCCLRYEYDAYKDFKSRAPKINAKIATPEGTAKVIDLDVPREVITLLLSDDKRVKIPLAEMTTAEGDTRPTSVSEDVLSTYSDSEVLAGAMDGFVSTLQFTGSDKLAGSCGASCAKKSKGQGKGSGELDKTSRRDQESKPSRRSRRRTHTGTPQDSQGSDKAQVSTGSKSTTSKKGTSQQAEKQPGQSQSKNRKSQNKNRNQNKGKSQATSKNKSKASESTGNQSSQSNRDQKKSPRPGQKSSGLRSDTRSQSGAGQLSQKPTTESSPGYRKARRRSHKAGDSTDK